MKKLTIMIASAVLFAACGGGANSGIDKANLDESYSPQEDFYMYACNGWMKNNPLDDEHSRLGTFDQLGDRNQEQLRTLVEEVSGKKNEPGTVADKIANIYNMAMDTATLAQQGAEPVQPMLQQVANVKSLEELMAMVPELHRQGVYPFFAPFNEADPDNSDMQIAWLYQTGLGIGDREYYVEESEQNSKFREAYCTMIAKLYTMSGYAEGRDAEAMAKQNLAFETSIALPMYDKNKGRDPHATNHKMSVEAASAMAPALALRHYFDAIGLERVQTFNLAQPEYFEGLSKLVAKSDLQVMKDYVAACVLRTAAPYLSEEFCEVSFDFYGRVKSGLVVNRPRWKRAVGTVEGVMGEALGQLYVAKYFPPEAKERMTTLVENLREAFGQRIDAAAWMDPETKVLAKEKLQAMDTKIGYPDKWRDYSGLEIKNDSYWQNIVRSNIFDHEYCMAKIDRPTDRTEWGMTPQTVNAYYNPTTNEICFPAGILQPPFFDLSADDAVNYGAIGMVIGHEMTHGFDDQGHNYDKRGNLNNWWKSSDSANFASNADVLVRYFDNIVVIDTLHADGKFTLGENIADNGGLHISFQAMKNAIAKGQVADKEIDGFSAAQRFFLAYARVWANNIRDEEIRNRTASDVHSLGRWRVNGTLPHLEEFQQAWNIQPGNAMYLAPEQRVQLW